MIKEILCALEKYTYSLCYLKNIFQKNFLDVKGQTLVLSPAK